MARWRQRIREGALSADRTPTNPPAQAKLIPMDTGHKGPEQSVDVVVSQLRAELESERTARRRAEEGLNNGQDQLIKALSDRARLIAAVEEHERSEGITLTTESQLAANVKLYERVRAITGEA